MFSKQSMTLTLRQTLQVFIGRGPVIERVGWMVCCAQTFFHVLRRDKAINNNNNDLFINEQIRDREVRVIGENGEQLGVMPIQEAMRLAEEAGVDLVKIAPTANPPVCKIVDYGKYKYEQLRKAKEAKKKQKIVDIKEIRMSPNIDTNDLNTKINAARKFLSKGNRVKFTIRFRGREMAHMGASVHILTDIAEQLQDIAVVEKEPRTEGRFMNMIMAEKR